MTTDLTFRVTSANGGGARYGSRSTGLTPQALADELAANTRVCRPEMTGLLTVYVWPSRDGEHYRQPIPDGAQRFDYPNAQES